MKKVVLLLMCVVISGCFSSENSVVETQSTGVGQREVSGDGNSSEEVVKEEVTIREVKYENTVEGHKEQVEIKKQELDGKLSVREIELKKLNELESKFNKFSTLLEEKENKLIAKIKSMQHDEYVNVPSYHIPFCGETGFNIISQELKELLEIFDMKEYMRIINDIDFLVKSSNAISYSDTFVTEEKVAEILENGEFYSQIALNLKKNVIFSFFGQNWKFVTDEEPPLSFKKDNAFLWVIKNGTVIQIPDGTYRVFNDGMFVGYETPAVQAPVAQPVPIKSGYSVPKKHRGVNR